MTLKLLSEQISCVINSSVEQPMLPKLAPHEVTKSLLNFNGREIGTTDDKQTREKTQHVLPVQMASNVLKTAYTKKGRMAERSKAPESGSGPKGRGFESHFCHICFSYVGIWSLFALYTDRMRCRTRSSKANAHLPFLSSSSLLVTSTWAFMAWLHI